MVFLAIQAETDMKVFVKPLGNFFCTAAKLFACIAIINFATALLVLPANNISVRLGSAQRAISASNLNIFVTTGEIPRGLNWYAKRLTAEERDLLRVVLQIPLTVTP